MINPTLTMKHHYRVNEFDHWADSVVDHGYTPTEQNDIHKFFTDKKGNLLEVGCGGGRLSKRLISDGFKHIFAIDFLFSFCKIHRIRFLRHKPVISQTNCDMTTLPFGNSSFRYVVYYGNVLSFLPNKSEVNKAFSEAWRVLEKGGILLTSVLDFDGRRINRPLSIFISLTRKFIMQKQYDRQCLPWLKIKHQINWNFFRKDQPHAYWFKLSDIATTAADSGFRLISSIHSKDVINGHSVFCVFQKDPSP